MADNSEIVEAALEWAKRGVPVFPCGTNKAPLTTNGHLDATTDPTQVRFLFENAGEVMIGARMGEVSGLFACDFDLYKPGAEQYMQYLSDKGLLNDTQIHTTKSGGIHLLYRGDGAYPNCKPALGVEIKGEGGYIIVPPSPGYAIQKRGIAYANNALVAELLAAKKVSSASTVDALKQDILSGKSFHDPLAQIAARRAAQGWPIERIQQELYDCLRASAASNKGHPRHSRWQSLIEDASGELARIVGSGNDKFNPNKATDKIADTIDSNPDLLNKLQSASVSLFGPKVANPEPEPIPDWGTTVWPFETDGYFSQTERDIFDQEYVAYPLFAERESVLIAAEPKAGKTAIALKLAMQVAYGEDLGENFRVASQRPVLYFTLEGARAVEMRVRAELDDRKDRGMDSPERDMLFVVDRPHNFASPDIRDANGAKIVLHNEMCKSQWGTELGLIVVDTLTKAMPGRDQNSVEDTSELFELIGFLRSHGVKATIVFIHHLAKTGQVRGSTNIEAEVDLVLGVQKDKTGNVWLNIRRARSMDEEIDYCFQFESRYLGETKQGHKLHAPVVRLVNDAPQKAGVSAAMAKRYADAMDALVKLGVGAHSLEDIVLALVNVISVPAPSGKQRKNYRTRAVQDAIDSIFLDKLNWSYGNYILRLSRDNDGFISTLKILEAK